jgi:hypothetical protein
MADNDNPNSPPVPSDKDIQNQKSLVELEKALSDFRKSNQEILIETTKNLEIQEEFIKNINKTLKEGGKLENQRLTDTQLQNKLIEATLKANEIELEQKRARLAVEIEIIKSFQEREKTNGELTAQEIEQLELAKERAQSLKEHIPQLIAANVAQEQESRLLIRRNDLIIDFGQSQAEAFKSTTGIGRESSTLVGRMIQLKGEGVDFSESLKEAGQAIAKQITLANVLAVVYDNILKATIEFAKEQDKAYASFEKSAGDVNAFKDQIASLREENGAYGISIADASKTFAQFKNELNGFTAMSKAQQNELAKTSAQLGVLGVAEGDVIKTQELLIKGMGMTVTESTNLQKSLYGTAQAMGLPPQKVAAEFAKAAPQLVSHGKNMTKVFLDLQNSAKNTGIAFERLLGITAQFDTFDAAANSAGKLNAILGGDYLNSIELLNATEGERVKILQDSLKASGKSVEQMSKQEQRAMAQALGLDVTELQKLMNNETAKGTVETMRAEEAQKKMNEAMQSAQELGEMWSKLIQRLAIQIRPVVEALKSLITVINEFIDENPNAATAIGLFIVGFGLLLGVMLLVLTGMGILAGFVNNISGLFGTAGPAAANSGKLAGQGLKSMASGVRALGNSLKGVGSSLIQFGIAMLLIGVSIAFATAGLAKLVIAFQGLGGKQILGALAALIIAMAGVIAIIVVLGVLMLAGIGAAAVGGILALGAAFLMMGAAVYIAASGIATIIQVMSPLAEILVGGLLNALDLVLGMIEKMAKLIAGTVMEGVRLVVELIKTLGSMNIANLFSMGPALFGIASGLSAIAVAGTVSSVTGFAAGVVGAAGSMLGFGSAAKHPLEMLIELQNVIDTFPAEKLDRISIAINNLVESLSKSVGSDLVNNLKSVVEQINDINLIKITALSTISATNTAPTSTISTTTAAARASSVSADSMTGTSNIVPVAIYIDSKKVGEILDPRYKQLVDDKLKKLDSKMVPV